MKIFKALLFIVFSFADVQIQAREVVSLKPAAHITMEPKNCLQESSLCSVLTPSAKKFAMPFGKNTATMDENTAVLREGATQITLLKGRIWVKAQEEISVRSEFGLLKAQSGEFWAEKSDKKVIFTSITSTLTMIPRGSQEQIIIRPHYENWLGPVAKDGVATSGIPKLLEIENHVGRWARLYPNGKRQFKKDVHEFFVSWYSMVEEASDKHREIALRTIASESERKRREDERQKVIHTEYNRVRDMMLRRLSPDSP